MKYSIELVLLALLALATLAFSSCVTTVTETTNLDGTVTKTTVTEPAGGVIDLGGQAIQVVGTQINPTK